MTSYETARGFVIPAPVGGFNTKQPLAAMDPSFCTWLENADAEDQFIKMRGGYQIHATLPSSDNVIAGLISYRARGDDRLFAYAASSGNPVIYDVTTSTPSLVFTAAVPSLIECFDFNFQGRSVFIDQYAVTNDNKVYNGATWANWGLTYGGVNIRIRAACYYKGRLYLGDNTLYFSTLNQVTGAIPIGNVFPVEKMFNYDTTISWIGTFSQSDGIANDDFIAFGNYSGEVVVYSGDFPGSPSWRLIAKFNISSPTSYNSIIQYQNDCLILTYEGVISLRQLYMEGNTLGMNNSVSENISSYWQDLITRLGNFIGFQSQPSGAYLPNKKKIYIFVRGYKDSDGNYTTDSSTMFVFNTDTKAWSIHKITLSTPTSYRPVISSLIGFNDSIYFACQHYVIKYDEDSFYDDSLLSIGEKLSIPMKIHSAYSVYGEQQAVTKLNLYQPVIEHDLPTLEMSLGMDFGQIETTAADIGYTEIGVSKPIAPFGCEGSFFQYRIEGESTGHLTRPDSSIGFKFYSMNASVLKGGPL